MSEWISIDDPRRPEQGERVQIKTVWNNDVATISYQSLVSSYWPEKGRYKGFGVLEDNAIKCWRPIQTTEPMGRD